jgi:hypothetical protein
MRETKSIVQRAVVATVLLTVFNLNAPVAHAQIVDIRTFLERCPTNDPAYAQIRMDFRVLRDGAPVGTLACAEPVSAVPVAQYSDELVILPHRTCESSNSAEPMPIDSSPARLYGAAVSIFLQQLDGYRKPDVYDDREGGVWNAYLRMQGVSALFDRLSRREGVTILEPLCHQPYGQTEFVGRDPNGYAIVLAEHD